MKSFSYKLLLLSGLFLVFLSCNEEEFLKEDPSDFFDPGNSFNTPANFESSLVDLYAKVREIYYTSGDQVFANISGTDIFKDARESTNIGRVGDYASTLDPTGSVPEWFWDHWYKIISNANTVIAKVATSELNPEQQKSVTAEARFFRAYAYRNLVYLYGGVPLVLEEITSTRTDFTRATREEVLQKVADDFTFAADNLPGIAAVADGRVSNIVAQHYLAETNISLGNFDAAIAAASTVIDDPNTALMTQRFGTRSAESGDVYWDLFRKGNQNRSSGNIEALWVAQMEEDVPGGLITTTGNDGYLFERYHVPVSRTLNDPDGKSGMLTQRSDSNQGGRGVSFLRPTSFFENDLWQSDFNNDIRNSVYNYQRDVIYDNPASAWFGQSAKDNPGSILLGQDWRWYPWLTKVTTPGNHPANLYSDPDLKLLKNSAGTTYADAYILRLAETYLLRAEAYMDKGDVANAASDINMVRARSQANPVSPGEVTLDYILDERARELSLEEQRRITLQRTGKLVERVRKNNAFNAATIQDFNALWPIPAAEIEANINGDLQQNPGY